MKLSEMHETERQKEKNNIKKKQNVTGLCYAW